jgi:hypothetical protein
VGEVLFALLFVGWFLDKGWKFQQSVIWKPIANVKTKRDIPIEKRLAHYSRKEIVDIFKKHKLSQRSLNKFLLSKKMHSVATTHVISYQELVEGLGENHVALNEVGIYAYVYLYACEEYTANHVFFFLHLVYFRFLFASNFD